jgi:hypothetical protein
MQVFYNRFFYNTKQIATFKRNLPVKEGRLKCYDKN